MKPVLFQEESQSNEASQKLNLFESNTFNVGIGDSTRLLGNDGDVDAGCGMQSSTTGGLYVADNH